MPRIPKEYINTSFFHIMVQGINKEYVFNNNKDKEKYLKIMKDTKEEINDIQIVSYCVMDNHVHILIYIEDTNNLIKFMHKVNLKYAKYYNKKYDRVGYVFRDRYKTKPIFYEKHLYQCIDYIHQNPVKAHMCRNSSEYQYSSYNNNCFADDSLISSNAREYINSRKFKENKEEIFIFMENDENKEEICKEILKFFLEQKHIDINEIKSNKYLILELVKKMRDEYKISYNTIGKQIGISRETLRKLIV